MLRLRVPRSGDSTARIWDLSRGRGSPLSTALPHKTDKNQQSKDVTTLDWNGDGSLLATGSYDGIARIWSRSGEAACRTFLPPASPCHLHPLCFSCSSNIATVRSSLNLHNCAGLCCLHTCTK